MLKAKYIVQKYYLINETEVTNALSGPIVWVKLRERPRTDSSCANFSLRVTRGLLIECVMLGGGWDDLSCEK